jgi:uncharacterized NAD-dependent epimerase/dehydratase family protein
MASEKQTSSQQISRRMLVLTDGHSNPITAKTAVCVLRYCPEQVVAVLDTTAAGQTAEQLLGVGGETPVVGDVESAPAANALLIGIAPAGGKIPPRWRSFVLDAIGRGMDIVSGLHEFLANDAEFVAAAQRSGSQLIDIRRNDEHDVSNRLNIREDCLRILTVGQDCCVGKMVVAFELAKALRSERRSTKFIATGQTGILIEGDGCPIDCVVSDFVSGAVEKLILAHQHHDILLVEGQGSLSHPRYSAVTLGLLHGSMPQGMILCYEVGRTHVNGMPHIPLASLAELREVYERMANLMGPSRVIGIGMNSRLVSDEEAQAERERLRREFGLPVCDVFRHGPDELVGAVLALRRELCVGGQP